MKYPLNDRAEMTFVRARRLLRACLVVFATQLGCTSDGPDPEKGGPQVIDVAVILDITDSKAADPKADEEWITKSLSKDPTLTVKLVNSSNGPFTLFAPADAIAAGLQISLFRNGKPVDGFEAKQIQFGNCRKVTLQRNESFVHMDRRYRVHITFHVPPGNTNESEADLDKWANLDLVE